VISVLHGDCLDVLPTLDADSFHSVVTDPPYHLTSIVKRFGADDAAPAASGVYGRSSAGFMGKQWDGGDVAFRPETWAQVCRVMKPGAFMAAFASTRGYHRMTCAIEDAGFIIHPMLAWVFGSGFPKATRFKLPDMEGFRYGLQALKPAMEPICLAQKPMIGTGNENWSAYGCGGLNIDGCRVETDDIISNHGESGKSTATSFSLGARISMQTAGQQIGRWPANLIHDGSDEVLEAFPDAPGQQRSTGPEYGEKISKNVYGDFGPINTSTPRGDSGSAARFFYQAKADSSDRAGSKHPTVKPLDLMRWVSRLITPPGGNILDPFAGTGSTGEAARLESFSATLIEREAEYVADIKRRLGRASGDDTPLFSGTAP
jgi:site-specific DNA-methyltransferase (adenine-specific)